MSAENIRKLRHKFIAISMASIFVVMTVVGLALNLVSYSFVARSIRRSLNDLIIENDLRDEQIFALPNFGNIFSPEYNRNHYFVVNYSADGEVADSHTNVNADEEERAIAMEYCEDVYNSGRTFGRKGNYFYMRSVKEDGTTAVALLDCTSEVAAIFRMLVLTVGISLSALLITFLLVWRFSERAVRPEIENNLRQKEFITNASHELKTPLAVIRANTELIEMTSGESEWTQSTLNQVERVEGLIRNLVMIARAQEQDDKSAVGNIDVTRAVQETVDTYEAVARQTDRTLRRALDEGVVMAADESKVRQLTTVLLDNAMKYCDEHGEVEVALSRDKKGICLVVSNTFLAGKDVDYDKFFDRFYRQDASHNIDKGGYGIGLSIADSICRAYRGSIRATWHDGRIYFACQLRDAPLA